MRNAEVSAAVVHVWLAKGTVPTGASSRGGIRSDGSGDMVNFSRGYPRGAEVPPEIGRSRWAFREVSAENSMNREQTWEGAA